MIHGKVFPFPTEGERRGRHAPPPSHTSSTLNSGTSRWDLSIMLHCQAAGKGARCFALDAVSGSYRHVSALDLGCRLPWIFSEFAVRGLSRRGGLRGHVRARGTAEMRIAAHACRPEGAGSPRRGARLTWHSWRFAERPRPQRPQPRFTVATRFGALVAVTARGRRYGPPASARSPIARDLK
jgi:hypothetical protein